jgi:YegS/Rv2252/BmrU family lipid kinase
MENMHVIINPTAGNHRAEKIAKRILARLDELKVDYKAFYTEYPGHAEEIAAQSALAEVKTVLSIGGDGTAFEIARGLMHSKTSLGIIPAGTGNDFIKSLRLPSKPLEILDFILGHPSRTVDAGTINGKVFINVCGTGFDVSVLDYSIPAKKYVGGMLPYLWGVIRTIINYHPSDITLEIDGERIMSREVLVCSIANGRFIGGGMPISPKSEIDDGLLDIVVIKNVTRLRMIGYLPGLLSGKILTFKDTTSYRGRRVVVSSGKPMRFNVDGEIFPYENVELEIVPATLQVYW